MENKTTDERIESLIEYLKSTDESFIFMTFSKSNHSVFKGSTFEMTTMIGFILKEFIDSLYEKNKEFAKHKLLLDITSSIIKANLSAWAEEEEEC